MTRRQKKIIQIGALARIFLFTIGAFLLTTLMIYSFRWEDTGLTVDFIGVDVSVYALAFVYVIIGLIGSSLVKSAILGRLAVD